MLLLCVTFLKSLDNNPDGCYDDARILKERSEAYVVDRSIRNGEYG